MNEKEKRIKELKQEVKELGYRLTPIQKYIRFEPCVCGRKYPSMWYKGYKGGYVFYKCPRCERAAHNAKSEREARIKWNEMVTRKRKED